MENNLLQEGVTPDDTIYSNLQPEVTEQHKYDHIIGNRLICSLHEHCTDILIKPTEVLEYDDKGVLQLVDKAK